MGSRKNALSPQELRDLKAQYDEIVNYVWFDALRFAQTVDEAPKRCGRRACRKNKACSLRYEEKPLTCGGTLNAAAIVKAESHASFAGLIVMRVLNAPYDPDAPWDRVRDW